MNGLPEDKRVNCEWFLNQLEELPRDSRTTVEVYRAKLPPQARQHAAECADCEAALRDWIDTQLALEGMRALLPEPGPWFTSRVMQSIAAQELEHEESVEGFWAGVRRLAPRLVAFAMLLLMVGGTWAFEQHRSARQNNLQNPSIEGIFQTAPSAPVNDDIVAVSLPEKP
jgi:hypothetical protein